MLHSDHRDVRYDSGSFYEGICAVIVEIARYVCPADSSQLYSFRTGRSVLFQRTAVKILDLAKKMIQLSGLILGKDIQIKYTGLRPGEKLYEELLNVEENTIPTHHPLILTAKVREASLGSVSQDIEELTSMVATRSNFDIIRKMKQMVPEYKSQNSVYEELDL